MANETKVQAFVHALEEGGWVSRINLILVLAVVASVYVIVILNQFKGLSDAKGMDQAQVGRQLASGQGFTTLLVRPIAYGQFSRKLGAFPAGPVPDTYNAPLNPFVDSLLLRLNKKSGDMTPKDIVYSNDRLIAGASLLFFLISVAVNFTIAKRLFDRRLAVLGMWLVLLCDVFWNFSLSGLPQMLMLLIFSLVNYCLVRAIENRDEGKNPLVWIALSGIGFGLLVLAHGLAAWIFAGALVYMAFAFLPQGDILWLRVLRHPAWIPLILVLGMEGPWLFRLYHLTGNPFGVALYSGFGQLLGSEAAVMRSLHLDTTSITFSWFRSKVQGQMLSQFANVYSYLGHSPIAPVFFVSLLHFSKRPLTASFRWCIFWMWCSALFGMSLFGLTEDSAIHANDLHVLFIPMAMFYGLAFVLVLWTRLANDRPEVGLRYVRWAFFALIYVISGFPLLYMLITGGRLPILWPPYYPGNIAILNTWTEPNEILVSDMPWAVAWYADRECVWLPDTVANFMDMYDYNRLNGQIVGLYLTPISGDGRFFTDIEKGEYKEWSPFIVRNMAEIRAFPLQAVTVMSIGNECIYFSDRDRWSNKAE